MNAETATKKGQKIVELNAELRNTVGSRACRRLRKQGVIPGVIYGHKQPNVLITVPEKEFTQHFYSGHRLVQLNLPTGKETGMIKEVQYDTFGDRIVHVDFARVSLKERVHMRVPVQPIGVAKGAAAGGVLELVHKELDIEGPAADIPEFIEVHVSEMSIGDVIRIKEIELPASCRILHADPEDVVVAIHPPQRAAAAAQPEAPAAVEEAVPKEEKKPKEEPKKAKEEKKE